MADYKCPVCGAPLNLGKCDYFGYQGNNQSIENGLNTQPGIVINNVQQNNGETRYYLPSSGKSKIVALLLCIFLGGAGVHLFYVGKIGTGILYLFTGGLFGIGWIIDIIKIATGSFTDCDGYPLKE